MPGTPRETIARFLHDVGPLNPFLGPPLPEKLHLYWPDFMLVSRPGVVTNANVGLVNLKSSVSNLIAGREIYSKISPPPRR